MPQSVCKSYSVFNNIIRFCCALNSPYKHSCYTNWVYKIPHVLFNYTLTLKWELTAWTVEVVEKRQADHVTLDHTFTWHYFQHHRLSALIDTGEAFRFPKSEECPASQLFYSNTLTHWRWCGPQGRHNSGCLSDTPPSRRCLSRQNGHYWQWRETGCRENNRKHTSTSVLRLNKLISNSMFRLITAVCYR